MREPFCQAEEAFRDTLITKAEGFAFDKVAALYGLPRIQVIQRPYWRALVHAAAYGPRDRLGTVWAAAEAIFDQWADPLLTFPVSLDPGTPQVITAAGTWTCAHVGRFVRVGDLGIYWSTGFSGFDLELSPVSTALWRGASWASAASVDAKILPFWVKDYGAIVEILIDAELFSAPPTYLQPNSVDARPAGQPIGGQLISSPVIEGADYRAIYLQGEELRGLLQVVLDSLCAAGVRVVLRSVEGCASSGLGLGSLADLLARGRVGGPGAFVLPTEWS